MASPVADLPIRPLTADEVLRMVEAGILDADEHVELLHGVLVAVMPQSPEHAAITALLLEWLAPSRDRPYAVRAGSPLAVPDDTSLPEPDIAVVERREPQRRHPSSALLAIEVSISSLRIDMRLKVPLYAAAGIREYWVLDVERRRLDRFTDPRGGRYARYETLAPPAHVQPLAVDVGPLDLTELFAFDN